MADDKLTVWGVKVTPEQDAVLRELWTDGKFESDVVRQARKQEATMADKRLKAIQRGGIEAIWILLSTGDVYYRAAAILLLQEYCKSLVASGRGEYASRLVQEIRDSDPYKSRHEGGKLRP